jgi:hypothetical protein
MLGDFESFTICISTTCLLLMTKMTVIGISYEELVLTYLVSIFLDRLHSKLSYNLYMVRHTKSTNSAVLVEYRVLLLVFTGASDLHSILCMQQLLQIFHSQILHYHFLIVMYS